MSNFGRMIDAAPAKARRIARTVNRWLRTLMVFIVVVATSMIAVATLPGGMKIVPWLALLPIFALIIVIIRINQMAVIGVGTGIRIVNWASRKVVGRAVFPGAGDIATWIAIGVVIDCLIGGYLSLVPVSNDRGLVIPIVLVMLGWTMLFITKWWSGLRNFLLIVAAILTLIFCLGGRDKAQGKAHDLLKSSGSWFNSSKPDKKDTGEHRLFTKVNRDYCEHDYAELDPNEDRFEVVLQYGCGLMMVEVPKTCRQWHPQWSKTREGQDPSQRWIGIKYTDTDVILRRWPDNLDRQAVPNRKMWLEGDEDDSITIVCEVRQ